MQKIWGGLSGKCYIFLTAQSVSGLREKDDQLLKFLSADVQQEKLSNVFLPSMLFPSAQKSRENLEAWRTFWNKERLSKFKHDLNLAARENGFAPAAFEPFWNVINTKNIEPKEIPEKYFEFLGITKTADRVHTTELTQHRQEL